MKAWLTLLLFLQLVTAFAQTTTNVPVVFKTVDIYVDAGQTPLAAYQLEFKSKTGNLKIVGIEGGEHPAFKPAPYYDPKAMQQDRAIIAAFSTSADLPVGKTRVATIHIQYSGKPVPDYALKLETAADTRGKKIFATATFEERKQP